MHTNLRLVRYDEIKTYSVIYFYFYFFYLNRCPTSYKQVQCTTLMRAIMYISLYLGKKTENLNLGNLLNLKYILHTIFHQQYIVLYYPEI